MEIQDDVHESGVDRCVTQIGGRLLSSSTSTIRVLCVDAHVIFREGIARAVGSQSDMTLIGEAATSDDAVASYRRHHPDVTLMGLPLRRNNGLKAIRSIRDYRPDARVIVLAMGAMREDVNQAYRAGAATYLLKEVSPSALLNVVRQVHAGRAPLPAEEHARYWELTARELECLRCVARGLNNREIAAEMGIRFNTVATHLKNTFMKLRVHNRTSAVTTALLRGFFSSTDRMFPNV
jgi:DNA-binding NarL/FixJ family response regulator